MISLIRWIWRDCEPVEAVWLTVIVVMYFLLFGWLFVICHLQERETVKLKLLLMLQAIVSKAEQLDRDLKEDIERLPQGYDWADPRLWEESRTEHEKRRTARRKRGYAKNAVRRAKANRRPWDGHRNLTEYIESCNAEQKED